MQLMYWKWPFELVVPVPVQPFEKPLDQPVATRPTKRKYVWVADPRPVDAPPSTMNACVPSRIGRAPAAAWKVIQADAVPEWAGSIDVVYVPSSSTTMSPAWAGRAPVPRAHGA